MNRAIEELALDELDRFNTDYLIPQRPVVVRGLVTSWPITEPSNDALSVLANHATASRFNVMQAPLSAKGQLGYEAGASRFNFTRSQIPFDHVVKTLKSLSQLEQTKTFAIQSAYVDSYFSGLEKALTQPLLPNARPRIWIGNKTKVAAHFDDADNIACVVAGSRTFRLFAPNQIDNLYIGPIQNTPAGTPVSIAPIGGDAQFSKIEKAYEHSLVATLKPGDAIFIPTLWWHQVEAHDDINVLVNYWSGGAIEHPEKPSGFDALLFSLMVLNDLPQEKKVAWSSLFNYYLFNDDDTRHDHITESAKGILKGLDKSQQRALKDYLITKLGDDNE